MDMLICACISKIFLHIFQSINFNVAIVEAR